MIKELGDKVERVLGHTESFIGDCVYYGIGIIVWGIIGVSCVIAVIGFIAILLVILFSIGFVVFKYLKEWGVIELLGVS